MRMLEPRKGETKMVEAIRQGRVCDRDADIVYHREIGQSHAPGLMLLAENHIPLRPVQGTPVIGNKQSFGCESPLSSG